MRGDTPLTLVNGGGSREPRKSPGGIYLPLRAVIARPGDQAAAPPWREDHSARKSVKVQ